MSLRLFALKATDPWFESQKGNVFKRISQLHSVQKTERKKKMPVKDP